MNKREFLKATGMLGAAMLIPFQKTFSRAADICTLIPTETAGPFPLDLTTNTFYFRQDVRETQQGVQFNLKLKIFGIGNCLPIPNLRVNIWHCSNVGLYSGYDQPGNVGQAGLTYLRGYQITDANGEVEFITIFPGWYTGRICHIHFQVYVSSSYAAISQLTFDTATKNGIYAANSTLYPNGADPTTYASDNVFSDGYSYQLATITPNATTGGYDGYLEVGIQGNGVLGVGNLEKENAKQFSLGQNFPNPYLNETSIPFHLKFPSDVTLDIYDLQGKKVASINRKNLSSGEHQIPLNLKLLRLQTAGYVYQVEVKNANGIYRDCKMMTPQK